MTAEPVRASIRIDAAPERVWEFFTRPEAMIRWMGEYAVLAPRPGGEFTVNIKGAPVRGRYLVLDPPHRLVHGWQSRYSPELAEEPESRVTWEIEPQEGGYCLLSVTHDQLDGSPKTAESVSGPGWMMVLSGLKTLLETGEPLA